VKHAGNTQDPQPKRNCLMNKLIAVATASLLITGCSDINESPNSMVHSEDVGGIRHFVTKTGVECVSYSFKRGYAGGGGISCNWEKFNESVGVSHEPFRQSY